MPGSYRLTDAQVTDPASAQNDANRLSQMRLAATGSATDAPVTDSSLSASVTSILKGILKILADVWSSANHYLTVSLGTRLDSTNDSILVAGVGIYAANQQDVRLALAVNVDAAVAPTVGLRLMGINIQETLATTASFVIKRGATAAGGTALASFKFLSTGNYTVSFPAGGLKCDEGISIQRVGGTCDVILYYKVVNP
jgi:hypothetical protein